jgi:hypothetical protein
VSKLAVVVFGVFLCVAGCKSDAQKMPFDYRPPLEPATPEPPPAPAIQDKTTGTTNPPKKRSIVDIASRALPIPANSTPAVSIPPDPVPVEQIDAIVAPGAMVRTSAKPSVATIAFEEIRPATPRLTNAPRVTAGEAATEPSILNRIPSKVWYCLASLCGGMFTYILAPLVVEVLKECMPRRRHQHTVVAWEPLPRFHHTRPWLRRG